jgi:hypothetical protein
MRKWVAARTVFRHCRFLPLILMEIYLEVQCFCLHISLYQITQRESIAIIYSDDYSNKVHTFITENKFQTL